MLFTKESALFNKAVYPPNLFKPNRVKQFHFKALYLFTVAHIKLCLQNSKVEPPVSIEFLSSYLQRFS